MTDKFLRCYHECTEPSIFAHILGEKLAGFLDLRSVGRENISHSLQTVDAEASGTAEYRAKYVVRRLYRKKQELRSGV